MKGKRLNHNERRLAELFFISAKREFNYIDLMEEFNVSHATVGRDIEYLRDVLGVPIKSSDGRYGGLMIYGTWSAWSKKMVKEQRDTILYLVSIHDGKTREVLISIMKDFGDSILAEELKRKYGFIHN